MDFDLKGLSRVKGRSPEVRKKRGRWLFFSGIVISCFFLLIYFFELQPKSIPPSTDLTKPNHDIAQESRPQEPQCQIIEGRVKEGSTLFQSLSEKSIPPHTTDLIVSRLKPYVNFKKIKGGMYQVTKDANGELVKFVYEAGPTEVYRVEREGQEYIARRENIPLDIYMVKAVGRIHSSLFEAMDAIGEQDTLTIAFAEVLAWEIDFYKDIREGDRFKVVVEKIYKGNEFIKYGPIHAVEYEGEDKIIRGIRYQEGYYNEQGVSLRKAFLKAPLRFNRISSRFSRSRKHPILGGVRPHFGVDYAAPLKTPVWAVADGTVVSCGWNGGYGRQVILRHANGYMTYYAHLSGSATGVKGGARVRQKQVIGYVGSTGLSTGPHLDYRLAKDDRFKNPLKESFPAGVPIGREGMKPFEAKKNEMMIWLAGDTLYQKKLEENEKVP